MDTLLALVFSSHLEFPDNTRELKSMKWLSCLLTVSSIIYLNSLCPLPALTVAKIGMILLNVRWAFFLFALFFLVTGQYIYKIRLKITADDFVLANRRFYSALFISSDHLQVF